AIDGEEVVGLLDNGIEGAHPGVVVPALCPGMDASADTYGFARRIRATPFVLRFRATLSCYASVLRFRATLSCYAFVLRLCATSSCYAFLLLRVHMPIHPHFRDLSVLGLAEHR